MDTRRLLTTIVIAGAVMLIFQFGSRLWTGKKPEAAATTAAHPIYAPPPAGPLPSEQGAVQTTLRLGDPGKDSKDKVAITINNYTAGIDRVELNVNDYTEHVVDRTHPIPEPLILLKSEEGLPKPYATIGLHIQLPTGEKIVEVDHYVWKMERVNPYQANLRLTVLHEGAPLLEVTKIFKVDPTSYDVSISHEIRNASDIPLKVAIDQLAATDLPRDPNQTDYRFFHAAGLDSAKKEIVPDRFNFTHPQLKSLAAESQEIGKFSGTNPLVWVASSGQFFVAVTRPTGRGTPFELYGGNKIVVVDHVASASVDILRNRTDVREIIGGLRLNGASVDIAAKSNTAMPLAVFFGPKKASILNGDLLAAPDSETFARSVFEYKAIIQFNQGGCYKYCTFDFLGEALVWMLNFLHNWVTFGNYGLAIILLVIMIRALLHPLTRASQVNMATMGKKMKDIQPLIEANKKKYAKDKTKLNEEMMRIYKEHKVNPAGGLMGCLPMLIQMPIWIAMWSALRTDIDLRHARFIPGWINDLSAPDMTWTFTPVHVPMVGWEIGALNILPLLLGVVFFLQMKVQTASQPKPADDQQAQMQKMSQYMVLIVPLFLYTQPSGLNLYYFASTLGGLVDTYFVRKTLKRKGILPANAKSLPTREDED